IPSTLKPDVPHTLFHCFSRQTLSLIVDCTEGRMAFSGTTQKCKACDKVVHFIESLAADGVTYHKTCFKCSHCNGRLAMSSYTSKDGILYCKPHFEQLFKETGNFSTKTNPVNSPCEFLQAFLALEFPHFLSVSLENQMTWTPSKLSSFFSGTQEKCRACTKTVYPLEKVTVEGDFYHKLCFKCAHGGCKLSPSSYAALDGFIYCKPHFAQLFKQKGSYNHLTKTASIKKNATAAVFPEPGPDDEAKSEIQTQ
ncbi:hypothetical protein C3L33_08563, partial [Rhododendron williamsianum]